MEALMQSCLKKALQISRFRPYHLAQRTATTHPLNAAAAASTLQTTQSESTVSASRSPRFPVPPSASSLEDLINPGVSSRNTSLHDQLLSQNQHLTCRPAGTGSSRGSYQGWLAAGAFPFAVAAYGGVALAKERAPLALPGEVVLYQYESCPFCNKVKAFLDYHDIDYKVVEVNPIGKKELRWSEYKKVPVLVVDGESLNDSSNIIAKLDERIYGKEKKPVAPNAEEEKWRKWVDEYLVHLLSPNIYRTPSEALEAFDYITTHGNFSWWERASAKYSGAAAMYFVGKRLKKRHNIQDERQELFAAADEWVEAVGDRKFLGGEKPNLADLAVFGVLRPVRVMQTGRELMANCRIGPWYSRMEVEVGNSNRLPDALIQKQVSASA